MQAGLRAWQGALEPHERQSHYKRDPPDPYPAFPSATPDVSTPSAEWRSPAEAGVTGMTGGADEPVPAGSPCHAPVPLVHDNGPMGTDRPGNRKQLWDERYSAPERVWSSGPNEHVAQIVAPLEPGTALDLGAGEGRHAVWLAERGWLVTAVDFSEVGLDRGRREAAERSVHDLVNWVPADVTTGDVTAGSASGRASSPASAVFHNRRTCISCAPPVMTTLVGTQPVEMTLCDRIQRIWS